MLNNLYYLDDEHQELTQMYLKQFRYETLAGDRQYGAFSYLIGATGKDQFLQFCSPEGIAVRAILDYDTPYSSTEWNFLMLALHLFNSRHGQEITIEKLFASLGAPYRKVVYTALELRYGFDRMLVPGWEG